MPHESKQEALKRIRKVLGERLKIGDDRDLPVKILYEDVVPNRGSVLIGSRRMISRKDVDRETERVLRK